MPASEQGADSQRYHVIPRTLIFAVQDGHVLLLKGAPSKRLWANRFNGIGGHIQPGEDVIRAARREFQEETGLTPQSLEVCGVIMVDTGQHPGIAIYVLRADGVRGRLVASTEGTVAWIPVDDQLFTLPLVEDLHVLLPRVLAYQPGDSPFSGLYWYDGEGNLQIGFAE
jgi:8-oxo-dGTP diphosphatase